MWFHRLRVQLLKKGYKATEVSKITGLHVNTITKIKKVGSFS
ncbi:helix-turn-helix domain-containing protein [Flavihumibacter profundi]